MVPHPLPENPATDSPQIHTAAIMHPAIIVVLAIGAIIETWIVFALVYALLQRDNGRGYYTRATDALKFKL